MKSSHLPAAQGRGGAGCGLVMRSREAQPWGRRAQHAQHLTCCGCLSGAPTGRVASSAAPPLWPEPPPGRPKAANAPSGGSDRREHGGNVVRREPRPQRGKHEAHSTPHPCLGRHTTDGGP